MNPNVLTLYRIAILLWWNYYKKVSILRKKSVILFWVEAIRENWVKNWYNSIVGMMWNDVENTSVRLKFYFKFSYQDVTYLFSGSLILLVMTWSDLVLNLQLMLGFGNVTSLIFYLLKFRWSLTQYTITHTLTHPNTRVAPWPNW